MCLEGEAGLPYCVEAEAVPAVGEMVMIGGVAFTVQTRGWFVVEVDDDPDVPASLRPSIMVTRDTF